MKWSWKIGKLSGIAVYVHATFLLLIGWVVFSHWLRGHSLEATVSGVAFVMALFACVVAHEFGHAFAARHYGIATRDITLLPIGGVARLERMPEEPRQEFWVAVAGPAVNVVIAAALYAGLMLSNAWQPVNELTLTSGSFAERLMVSNIFLVVFNLIPAFPMDGGRVLRAILASRISFARATQIAATVGQGCAMIFGFLGLFSNPFLLFIAFFVWIGASQESAIAQVKSSVNGVPVSRAMLRQFDVVEPNDTLRSVAELVLRGSQTDFPVVAQGRLIAVLTRQDLMKGLAVHGPEVSVAAVARAEVVTVESSQSLEEVLAHLHQTHSQVIPVMEGVRLVGLLTAENLMEFLMIREAMSKSQGTLSRPFFSADDRSLNFPAHRAGAAKL